MAIKQSIKNNIVSANNKYNLSFEKVARILSKNEEDNSYDISIVGSDGIGSLYENISIRYDGSDAVSKIDPKVGEYVYTKEDNGRFVITGIVSEHQNNTTESDIFSNTYNGATGSLLQ